MERTAEAFGYDEAVPDLVPFCRMISQQLTTGGCSSILLRHGCSGLLLSPPCAGSRLRTPRVSLPPTLLYAFWLLPVFPPYHTKERSHPPPFDAFSFCQPAPRRVGPG